MSTKIKFERRKKKRYFSKWLRRTLKLSTFFLTWFLIWMFFAGAEITIVYNKEKTLKARKNFWEKTLKFANYVGDFKEAIFR